VLTIRLGSGPRAGERTTAVFSGDALSPLVEAGARIRVVPNVAASGSGPLVGATTQPWVFVDYDRRTPLLLLGLLFAVVIVVLGRRRGLFALLGLGASLFLLVRFVVPAILEGHPPVLVAVVGALAVLLVTLGLAHGLSVVTVAAALGASATLVLTVALARLSVDVAQLTGFVSDQAVLLQGLSDGELSPQGLLLAGIVIGALGVLDDVTVSRPRRSRRCAARARARLAAAVHGGGGRRARPPRGDRQHARARLRGRGAAGLLVFSTTGTTLAEAANREIVAQELVALLVGSIGIAAAVPLTTAISSRWRGACPWPRSATTTARALRLRSGWAVPAVRSSTTTSEVPRATLKRAIVATSVTPLSFTVTGERNETSRLSVRASSTP
jgi:hypothetical protein